MQIYETGCDHQTVGIDNRLRRIIDRSDLDNYSLLNTDVGSLARPSGSVDDLPTFDDAIEHEFSVRCIFVGTTESMLQAASPLSHCRFDIGSVCDARPSRPTPELRVSSGTSGYFKTLDIVEIK